METGGALQMGPEACSAKWRPLTVLHLNENKMDRFLIRDPREELEFLQLVERRKEEEDAQIYQKTKLIFL